MKRGFLPVVSFCALLASATVVGCGFKEGHGREDLVNGKKTFVAKCGACHTLARASTTGVVGPNLDQAFDRAVHDGIGRSTIRGVVYGQIKEPARRPQVDPKTGKPGALMPANLVNDEDALDIAAYVAQSTANPGKDTGALAQAGAKKSQGQAKAQGGVLNIPTDPSGALSYQFATAVSPAGQVTIRSQNKSSVDHDIAIEGPGGVKQKGATVKNGGVSEIKINLKPGQYTFYCSVDGHRQGGMLGKLTIK